MTKVDFTIYKKSQRLKFWLLYGGFSNHFTGYLRKEKKEKKSKTRELVSILCTGHPLNSCPQAVVACPLTPSDGLASFSQVVQVGDPYLIG